MNAIDISPFLEAQSDQITADDLIAGPRSYVIARVEMKRDGEEKPVHIYLEGADKPFRPCKGMARLLAQMWGPDAAKWVGRGMTLFRDPDVRYGADVLGGVRISALSHLDEAMTVAVRASKKKVKGYRVEPLRSAPPAPETDKAADWLEGQLAAIESAQSVDELDEIMSRATKPLARLAASRTELHARFTAAFDARHGELVADDTDPFGDGE